MPLGRTQERSRSYATRTVLQAEFARLSRNSTSTAPLRSGHHVRRYDPGQVVSILRGFACSARQGEYEGHGGTPSTRCPLLRRSGLVLNSASLVGLEHVIPCSKDYFSEYGTYTHSPSKGDTPGASQWQDIIDNRGLESGGRPYSYPLGGNTVDYATARGTHRCRHHRPSPTPPASDRHRSGLQPCHRRGAAAARHASRIIPLWSQQTSAVSAFISDD
jgi:hypothetical protein